MKEFSLYIHWPFCLKKCPYCDFNSYVFDNIPSEWVNTLIAELKLYEKVFKGYKLKSIFFGGGTPSLIPPNEIKRILEYIFKIWPNYEENIEITIEVNPSSLETYNLDQVLKAGVNRFSIGVQSLNDDNLQFLGRIHSSKEAVSILTHASKICNNISADFIYTLPYDTLASWKKDLNKILELLFKLNIKHCSLYQLVIEPNTGFEQAVRSKKWVPMNEDLQSILYRHTHKTLNKVNWNYYEISNASINKDYQCQHNLAYWNYKSYLGIGPGAHSRMMLDDQKYKFNNFKNPYKWKKAVEEKNHMQFPYFNFLEGVENLSEEAKFTEKLLMGFRLTEGIEIHKKEYKFLNIENLELLIKKKFIKVNQNKFNLSLSGRLKLNTILKMIIK